MTFATISSISPIAYHTFRKIRQRSGIAHVQQDTSSPKLDYQCDATIIQWIEDLGSQLTALLWIKFV